MTEVNALAANLLSAAMIRREKQSVSSSVIMAWSSGTDNFLNRLASYGTMRHAWRTKKKPCRSRASKYQTKDGYIMPPMSGGAAGIAGFSSGISATMASVVIINPAIDDAFCSAARATFVGSRIPISIMSPYSPVAAL